MVELYFFQPLGSHSGRVYLTLLEKGVEFVEHELSGRSFEQLNPGYLALNPKGQVPVLVHDGHVLTEGAPICEYIDEAFAGPPLRPVDLRERCNMRRWCRFIDSDIGRSLMMIHWSRIVPTFVGTRTREEVEALIARVPDPDRRHAWRIAYLQQIPATDLAESHRRVGAAIEHIEATLARQAWIGASGYSLADIDLLNFYAFLANWSPQLLNGAVTPHTMDWIRRMGERPAVRQMRARTRAVGAPAARTSAG